MSLEQARRYSYRWSWQTEIHRCSPICQYHRAFHKRSLCPYHHQCTGFVTAAPSDYAASIPTCSSCGRCYHDLLGKETHGTLVDSRLPRHVRPRTGMRMWPFGARLRASDCVRIHEKKISATIVDPWLLDPSSSWYRALRTCTNMARLPPMRDCQQFPKIGAQSQGASQGCHNRSHVGHQLDVLYIQECSLI